MKEEWNHNLLVLLPNNTQLEPACEGDNVHFTREVISDVQVFDKIADRIIASIKIEQPGVHLDYPGEDMKIYPCSQSCLSL